MENDMNAIRLLLGGGDGGGAEEVSPPTEIQLQAATSTLLELYERFITPCPFAPGTLITPRKGHGYTNAGQPYVVLQVFNPPLHDDMQNRADVRFGVVANDSVGTFLGESWSFELYTGPTMGDSGPRKSTRRK